MPEWVGAHTILWASKKNVRRAAVRCSTLKAVTSVQTAEISDFIDFVIHKHQVKTGENQTNEDCGSAC
jgi:hypothetical protein